MTAKAKKKILTKLKEIESILMFKESRNFQQYNPKVSISNKSFNISILFLIFILFSFLLS
jgi:type IV secretory pathway component VirB8